MLNPILLVGVLLLLAVLCVAVAVVVDLQRRRREHPSIKARRKALDEAIMMEDITADEYADRTNALDREEERARLKRRLQ